MQCVLQGLSTSVRRNLNPLLWPHGILKSLRSSDLLNLSTFVLRNYDSLVSVSVGDYM